MVKKVLAMALGLCMILSQMPAVPAQAETDDAQGYVAPTYVAIENSGTYGQEKVSLQIGQSLQLRVSLSPNNAFSGITWESSDPSVVSVDECGMVTALKRGAANITATTYNGKQDSCIISVPNALPQLQYELTADGTGYEVVGYDATAYAAHIPATYNGLPVVSIRGGAFKKCSNLRYFTVDAENQTFYAEGGVIFTDIPEKTLVCFPPAYDEHIHYYAPEDTVAVAAYAFAGSCKVEDITLQEGVKKLGDYALLEVQANWSGNLALHMPDSLTDIGLYITQGAMINVLFLTHAGTAAQAYAKRNQIPCAILSDFHGDPTTVETGAPAVLTGEQMVPTAGPISYYDAGQKKTIRELQVGSIKKLIDLSELQNKTAGEIRVVLSRIWTLITPDPNGNTTIDHSPQTGLYGAGYTEGEAILRGYDRAGNLIAMQYISGDFAFSFPSAVDIGVEGGKNTQFTVLPVEPVFIASSGTYSLEDLQWHQNVDGTYFQCFILRMPHSTYTEKLAEGLNLLSYSQVDTKDGADYVGDGVTTPYYSLLRIFLRDTSMVEQMSAVSFVFDGFECLYEDEYVKCMIGGTIEPAENFGQRASALAQQVQQIMLGSYVPADLSVHQMLIDSSASGSDTAASGNIQLHELTITSFAELTIAHEMVHAVDQNIASVEKGFLTPSPWLEGRAQYISAIICGRSGEPGAYDWSFLSEVDKADFFQYYFFRTNRYTTYDVGHHFLYYLLQTYGEDVSMKIMENMREQPVYKDEDVEEAAAVFKKCVEDATEVGVFQNFVCEVINAGQHTEVVDPTVETSCAAPGWTEGSHCSVCGKVFVAQEEIPALSHTPGEVVVENAVDATCTTAGSHDNVVSCTVCEAEISRETIRDKDPLGHTEVIDAAVDATCTASGKTEGKHCSVCNEILVAQKEIPTIDHSFGEWSVSREATAEAEGEEIRACTECGVTETHAIAKLPAVDDPAVDDPADDKPAEKNDTTLIIMVAAVAVAGIAMAAVLLLNKKK